MNSNWILKNGVQITNCTTFPYAYRTAHNMLRKMQEAGKPTIELIKSLSITGPPNTKGERQTYSWPAATQFAIEIGLLTSDGQINSREFKRR